MSRPEYQYINVDHNNVIIKLATVTPPIPNPAPPHPSHPARPPPPPTALADDLSTLQRQLTECVESQVNARRAQVDEWMERCDEVQNACVRYGRALGGHVKATGSCVGEIGREGVLPRRFEMITEYQEKLRQVCAI